MNILAIETSCDETAAAVLKDGKLLSNVVVSQIDIFKAYGGVIPEVAARSHLEAILPVIDQAFDSAGFKTADGQNDWAKIDALAVTHTPGLLGSLLIGTLTARTLAILHNKPLYAIHHLKSHIYSNWLKGTSERSFEAIKENPQVFRDDLKGEQSVAGVSRTALRASQSVVEKNLTGFSLPKKNLSDVPTFPLLALVISGGHTQIIKMQEHNDFHIIGTTLDDAVGECFDKIAKILGLPYPGGPSIATAATKGNPKKYHFPHPQVAGLDFSFSGLKTAVLRTVQKECGVDINYPSHNLKNLLTTEQINDFAASFQATAIDIMKEKLELTLQENSNIKSIVFAGGVSANNSLRASFEHNKENPQVFRDDLKGEQSMAGASRSALRASPSVVEKNLTGFSHAKKNALNGLPVYFPAPQFSGDNAAMVAMAAYWEIQSGVRPTDPFSLNISPRSPIS